MSAVEGITSAAPKAVGTLVKAVATWREPPIIFRPLVPPRVKRPLESTVPAPLSRIDQSTPASAAPVTDACNCNDPPEVTLKLQKNRSIEMTAVTSSGAIAQVASSVAGALANPRQGPVEVSAGTAEVTTRTLVFGTRRTDKEPRIVCFLLEGSRLVEVESIPYKRGGFFRERGSGSS